ncbi:recombination regulator RecX [Kangiella spongicola]|uniref:Regulatory protein RecX n=1 Tax=Kangiella spongicola TaxID=796379 RepID=A0A318D0V9_9GAMM|nr:recombination regulator RecX [Kangiella spongicola]MBV36815.1 recombination regulator RecX [Rickettsiales bacterium]PXF62846.1 recombination regulator RecX [Kangiella spongicola]
MGFKKPPRDYKIIAMDLLARREHSRRELIDKLKLREFEGEEVEEYLDRLAERGLQSDQRFAESFIRQRSTNGYGPLRVRQELRKKGIEDSAISHHFETMGIDWFQVAVSAWRKKYNQAPGSDMKLRAKQTRFLQYRGFDFDMINHAIETGPLSQNDDYNFDDDFGLS